MQKVINVLALASFVVSAGVVGGGYWVYNNREAIVEDIKEQITKAATDGVMGGMGGSIPSAPGSGGGGGLPGVTLPL